MHRFPLANKQFGQHFLTGQTVISKITSPAPENIDGIIEIGPGPAVLTPHLASYKKPLFVIEMDERFIDKLEKVVDKSHIYIQDAMEFDWKIFLEEKKLKSLWLVSNLPYNVSVPLTLSFLRIPQIQHMTLMYQKEVAQKILPNDPRNAMNSLHVMCQTQFEVKHVVYAPPGAFVPPPKVESQVLGFTRKKSPLLDLEQVDELEKFLRVLFGQKRKQIGGILKHIWGKELTEKILNNSGCSREDRAEALSIDQVLKLFQSGFEML